MELYQLRSFAEIADTGQLTRAAEKLHVSQPALSAQLKALEEELDFALFDRTPNGMVLTTAGRRLLADAEKVLAAAHRMQLHAKSLKGATIGKARIGTLSDPQFIRVGEFMNLATTRYPMIDIELHQGVTGEVLQRVRDGELDAAFYYGELLYPSVDGIKLRDIVYRVAAPASLCEELKAAGWSEIAKHPWIIPPPISTHHRLVHTLLAEHGVEPSRVVEVDQETVVASLVVSGVGIALIREDVALQFQDAGAVCIWDGVRITSQMWFIHLKERASDPIISALLEVEKEVWNP